VTFTDFVQLVAFVNSISCDWRVA